MFETSVIRAQALPSRRKYTLLTVSLIAHSAVVAGAIAVGIASTSFPQTAPDEFATAPIFMPVTVPPPLGNPNGGAQPKPAQPQPKQPTPAPAQPTAPTTVPESVTLADAPSTGNDVGPTTGVPGPIGVPWGVKDSIGDIDAPPVTATQPAVENKIYTVGEVKAPVILHRVEPVYPPALVRAKMPGKVAVHCVIDKNGRVRDAQVVFATMPAFGDSVLRALQQWRYQPASLKGEAVDCYLDLTVDFGVR